MTETAFACISCAMHVVLQDLLVELSPHEASVEVYTTDTEERPLDPLVAHELQGGAQGVAVTVKPNSNAEVCPQRHCPKTAPPQRKQSQRLEWYSWGIGSICLPDMAAHPLKPRSH